MTLRAVIVDDETPARDRLRRMLADHPDVVLVGEAANADSAVELLDRERPDLCFLDVQMPEGDGFDVLRRSRHVPEVIFVTAFDQYAVRAFEVRSLDYLLKPFSKARLNAALERARRSAERTGRGDERIVKLLEEIRAGLPGTAAPPAGATPPPSPESRIPARKAGRIVLLNPAEVFWFEAEDVLVHARTAEGRLLVERTLSDLETSLAGGFFRIHRSYLANLSRVAEILPGEGGTFRVVMRDEARTALPLSRRQARRLREVLGW
jgi:two-component system, LytTR family, response regulator